MNIRNSIILTLSVLCCACAKPPKKVSIPEKDNNKKNNILW